MSRKIVAILFIGIFIYGLIGCSSINETYENAIEQGLSYLEDGDYEKAQSAFKRALEEKNKDERASKLHEQTSFIIQAQQQLNDGMLEEAEASADRVIEVAEESTSLVSRAKEIKDEINQLKEQHKQFIAIYEHANDLLDQQVYGVPINLLTNVLENDLDHTYFQDIKSDLVMLLKEIKKAKEAKELAAKKEEERKAEEVRKNKEAEKQAAANQSMIENFTGYWLAHDMACHITTSYIACAAPYSDFIINEKLKSIEPMGHSKAEITYMDGVKVELELKENNTVLVTDGIPYRRVSKEEANAIYDGYYELP